MIEKNIISKKSFHFWNSLNFLIVIMIITTIVLKFGDKTKLLEATEISRLICNWLSFASGFTCIAYFIYLRKKCGKLQGDFIWLIVGSLLILRGIIIHFSIKYFGLDAFPIQIYIFIHAICLLILISFLSVNTMISINCFVKPKKDAKYVIIHGAKTGSRVLNNRIDTAADYILKNNKVLAIASGGKGKDEKESEANYILERLTKEGINPNQIIVEDHSTTTHENLLFSKEIMMKDSSFIVTTDDYHILRARLLARKLFGYMPEGLPVHSSKVSLPHYIVREYFSLIYNSLKGNLF